MLSQMDYIYTELLLWLSCLKYVKIRKAGLLLRLAISMGWGGGLYFREGIMVCC